MLGENCAWSVGAVASAAVALAAVFLVLRSFLESRRVHVAQRFKVL